MITTKQLSFLLLSVAMFFTSCSNSKLPDDSLKNVPEEVTSITAFNLNQMMQKADYDYVKNLDFFQAGIADLKKEKPELAAIMEDPFSAGIDLTKNAYMIMEMDKIQPEENPIGALVFSISDDAAFQKIMEQIANKTATQRSNFKMMPIDKNGMVAWNQNFGIIAGGGASLDMEDYISSYFDKTRKTSVADHPDLVDCLAKDYDIATWVNSNAIAENAQLKTAASFMGISPQYLKGNYFHSYFNFEKGTIQGNTEHLLQKELTNDLQLFFKGGIKKDLSKYIPSKNLGLAFSAALDAKGIYQIISEKTGGATAVNAGLKKYGFTGKDVANAFGGDMVVAVYNNPEDSTHPNGLLTATIGDRKLFDQFLDLGVQFEILVPEGENVYRLKNGPNEMKNSFLFVSEEVFFVTNGVSMLETIQQGGYASAEKMASVDYDALTSNAFGGLVNFDMLKQLEKDFKEIPFTTAKMNAGLTSSSMQVELKNKDVNSLKALFEMINNLYLKDKKAKEQAIEAEVI